VVSLKGDKLWATLPSSKVDTHYAQSADGARPRGRYGPSGLRGTILASGGTVAASSCLPIGCPLPPGTAWQGPVRIDPVGGAYPSTVELPGGLVCCLDYEERKGPSIRGVWLGVDPKGVSVVPGSGKLN
jgi:hypothetical protein